MPRGQDDPAEVLAASIATEEPCDICPSLYLSLIFVMYFYAPRLLSFVDVSISGFSQLQNMSYSGPGLVSEILGGAKSLMMKINNILM